MGKSNNFCYCKVKRVITKWGAIEKSPILQLQYWKIQNFGRVPRTILYFGGTNICSLSPTEVQSSGNTQAGIFYVSIYHDYLPRLYK